MCIENNSWWIVLFFTRAWCSLCQKTKVMAFYLKLVKCKNQRKPTLPLRSWESASAFYLCLLTRLGPNTVDPMDNVLESCAIKIWQMFWTPSTMLSKKLTALKWLVVNYSPYSLSCTKGLSSGWASRTRPITCKMLTSTCFYSIMHTCDSFLVPFQLLYNTVY